MAGRLLIVSNRLPVTVRRDGRVGGPAGVGARDPALQGPGPLTIVPSSGGVATGLRVPHETSGGLWIGWSGVTQPPDGGEQAELDRRLRDERLVPVPLTADEVRRYYDGFANGFIWPVFHYLAGLVPLHAEDWETYAAVNRRFADAVAAVYQPGDRIWVHDYHLMLVPGYLRERLPDARIGFFLHIPFPAPEVFRTLPGREDVLRGMLGADLIGFHTSGYLRHFAETAMLLIGVPLRGDRITWQGRSVRLGAFPMGVDAARFSALGSDPEVRAEAAELKRDGECVLLSIDRLDYTKGVPRRLLTFEKLLRAHPELREKVRLVSLSVPSRVAMGAYKHFRKEVDAVVGRINGAFATPRWVPIHYMYRSLPLSRVAALYRAADVMLVTPIRDGMNLVAKEYVATRSDEDGVLVLSEYAGASEELAEALLVNPYEVDRAAEVYYRALTMSPEERRTRMRALRSRVLTYDVHRWAESFLSQLEAAAPVAGGAPRPAMAALPTLERAPRVVLLLDYDGTLVPMVSSPELAVPDDELLALLGRLARAPRTEVHVVSGRTTGFLDRWLGDLPVHLHGEHGAVSRDAGKRRWRRRDLPNLDWQRLARPILSDFARRTPGASVEPKEATIAWHWRKADPAVASRHANELGHHLSTLLANEPVELLWGDQVLELRPYGLHKGLIAREVADAHMAHALFVAMGDDRSDEDLFRSLPAGAITVAVGTSVGFADFQVEDVAQARRFLGALADVRTK
ncbi:MAG: bifunctional alpha,alpha-trehalose-phosphate synthase (UDP-forming)/trehalose-phosphatase [Gemmatimonadales bacterium]